MNTLTERFRAVRAASLQLADLSEETVNRILLTLADRLVGHSADILRANREDLSRMDPADPKYDRLKLTEERIAGIAADMRQVASLNSPVGEIISENRRPNGMTIRKVRVPFGVIGIIYEARPNVTLDVFSLCLKTGNACILKGGKDASCTNRTTVGLIHEVLTAFDVDSQAVMLMPDDRESTAALLEAEDFVDLIIPRGSRSLIDFVRAHAKVPVIETGAGICHVYFDASGDKEKGAAIINNAKTRRVSVCNALDCLIIHESRLADLPFLCGAMATKNVTIYADAPAYDALKGAYPYLEKADATHFGTEFLDYKMAVRTVSSIDEALAHIRTYSSKHSEAIVAEDAAAQALFQRKVDAACVYVNLPTSWTDGAQFGFGAEIGISTQKLHARGPMALPEITTYKYLITGDGQIRQ